MSEPTIDRDPRVYLAAERTTLAWIRTGIALMAFGFVVARFGLFFHELETVKLPDPAAARDSGVSIWVGTALVVIGAGVNLAAAAWHVRFRRRFERGEPFLTRSAVMIVVVSALMAALGVAMVVYLVAIGRI
jgi:putative membrane protein